MAVISGPKGQRSRVGVGCTFWALY